MQIKILFQLFLFIAFSNYSFAFEGIPVSKISDNFVFDGEMSAGEWDHIAPIDLTTQTPVYHGDPSQLTIVKLGYDQSYIYLSGELFDTEPDKILANTKLRDGGDPSTDWFGLVIDSYNDKQNALSFFTTPTGSRFDAAILNDANGRNPMNLSWNNFWDVKTNVTDKGWFVEMRIPFSSLQYQVIDGKVIMGITIWRYIARSNELQICPDIPPDLGEMGQFRPSQAKEYVFENIEQKKPFYITPYVLAGLSNEKTINSAGTDYNNEQKFIKDLGIDVKYGITNNFTLDLTLNTDFAQVEADDQQINLTRFSLFFPEKRLFFQERSGIFDFSLGSQNNLFYSRRIGIDGDGNAVPIIGGARLTGRSGNTDVGIISMQTQATDELASNNYSVLRLKRRIINENSDAGFLLTNSIDRNGKYNTVYGFDTNIRITKDNFLNVKFAQSLNDDVERSLLSINPSVFWASLSKRSERGFTYATSLSRVGEDFHNNLGFQERENYTRWGVRTQYNFFSGEHSRLFRHGITIRGASFWENDHNTFNSSSHSIGYNWQWKNGSNLTLGAKLNYDDINEPFDLADIVMIPIDQYFYSNFTSEFSTTASKPYLLKGEFDSGKFFDGYKNTISLSPVYNVSPSLSLSATYEFNDVNFKIRDEKFAAHIARIKALVMFSTKLSISSFIQYNSLDKLYLGNIRFRYNPKEGNDLFIVYNSDLNANRSFLEPRLPLTNQSSVLLKYSYTFTL